ILGFSIRCLPISTFKRERLDVGDKFRPCDKNRQVASAAVSDCPNNRNLWVHALGSSARAQLRTPAIGDGKLRARRGSDCLRHHHDRAARALLGAEPASLAEIVVELESVAGPELDHGIVGTNAVAVVALEAVAAGEAP